MFVTQFLYLIPNSIYSHTKYLLSTFKITSSITSYFCIRNLFGILILLIFCKCKLGMVNLLLYYYLIPLINPSVSKHNSFSFTYKNQPKLDPTNELLVYFTHLIIFYIAESHIQKHTIIPTIQRLNKLLRYIFKVASGSFIICLNYSINLYICLYGHINICTYIAFVYMQNCTVIDTKLCVKYRTCLNEIMHKYLLIPT